MIPDELWEKVIRGIASGLTNRDACALAGIKENTFYVRRAKDKDFDDAVKAALIQFKLKHITTIARDPSWQSSAWLLERKFRDEFGRNITITPQEQDSDDKKVDYNRLSASELELLLELERKAAGEPDVNPDSDAWTDAEIVEDNPQNNTQNKLDPPK